MKGLDMDIERFFPHTQIPAPAVIAALPATIEMTGFSDPRHYHEQQTGFSQHQRIVYGNELWLPSLDCHQARQ